MDEFALPAETAPKIEPPPPPKDSPSSRELVLLAVLLLVSALCGLPLYRVTITVLARRLPLRLRPSGSNELLFFAAVSAINLAILFCEGALGIWAARKSKLAPMPTAEGHPDGGSIRAIARRGIRIGGLCALISVAMTAPQIMMYGMGPSHGVEPSRLSRHMRAMDVMRHMRGWRWIGELFLGAPIREEIEFRLLFVSVIAWLVAKAARSDNPSHSRSIKWVALVTSGIAFGLFHIIGGQSVAWWRPMYQQIFLDPRTYIGIVLALTYWNRGIETSLAAHSAMNLILITATELIVRLAQIAA